MFPSSLSLPLSTSLSLSPSLSLYLSLSTSLSLSLSLPPSLLLYATGCRGKGKERPHHPTPHPIFLFSPHHRLPLSEKPYGSTAHFQDSIQAGENNQGSSALLFTLFSADPPSHVPTAFPLAGGEERRGAGAEKPGEPLRPPLPSCGHHTRWPDGRALILFSKGKVLGV